MPDEPDIAKITQAYANPELAVITWSLLEVMLHQEGMSEITVIDECWRRGIRDAEHIALVLTILTKFSAMTIFVTADTRMDPAEFARKLRLADRGPDSDAS